MDDMKVLEKKTKNVKLFPHLQEQFALCFDCGAMKKFAKRIYITQEHLLHDQNKHGENRK
jgi:hypothetical protein